jgi:carotenoid cleavage dioxygenase
MTVIDVREEQVDDRPGEFPRVADSVVGLKHRYGYMMSIPEGSGWGDADNQSGAILKYDRQTGARLAIEFERGQMPGEPVFVPAERGKTEDDGYLMTFLYDAASDASRFVILDAATMDATPVASVELPRVPSGFHGSWIPAAVAS